MGWKIDWNAVAALGQCAGAIATPLAVVVALWIAKSQTAVRIKVTVSNAITGGPVAPSSSSPFTRST